MQFDDQNPCHKISIYSKVLSIFSIKMYVILFHFRLLTPPPPQRPTSLVLSDFSTFSSISKYVTRSRPVCTPARVCSFHTWLKSCLTSDQITKFIFINICLALPVYAARWTLHVQRCTLCGGHCTCSDVRCAVDTARAAMYAVR